MNPEQYFHPKLGTAINKKGKIISPPLEDLSPLLDRKELKKSMIISIHKKSEEI
jgi:acetolactate synthase-1/2/3 large subunit